MFADLAPAKEDRQSRAFLNPRQPLVYNLRMFPDIVIGMVLYHDQTETLLLKAFTFESKVKRDGTSRTSLPRIIGKPPEWCDRLKRRRRAGPEKCGGVGLCRNPKGFSDAGDCRGSSHYAPEQVYCLIHQPSNTEPEISPTYASGRLVAPKMPRSFASFPRSNLTFSIFPCSIFVFPCSLFHPFLLRCSSPGEAKP